jgi:hypothetical protein
MTQTICYLCGLPGADTKEHVIPRAFLSKGNYNGQPRLTLPAHRKCNQAFSADEEYARDLLLPAAQELNLPGIAELLSRADRSRKREAGFKRRQGILKTAKIVEKFSAAGLYVGSAIAVAGDLERMNRVGRKIAQGVIFSDTNVSINRESMICASLPITEVAAEKDKEIKSGNPYWILLSNPACVHDTFTDNIAVRRVYFGHPTSPKITIDCMVGVVLLERWFVIVASFPYPDSAPDNFQCLIDESTGAWVRKEKVAEGLS